MSLLTGNQKFIQVALKYAFSLFGIPKTGQTIVYPAGDDGTYQAGYPKTGARFTDNGDGTITDNATGLMWVKDGTGAGCNSGNKLGVYDTIDFCEALNFAGHADWRLPNITELVSIIDYGVAAPRIDTLFINTAADRYWSSTTDKQAPTNCATGNFSTGSVDWEFILASYSLRPVRGGRV